MKRVNSEKAISLIALLVTILILIIISVISISMLINDGLIEKANSAGTKLDERQNVAENTLQGLKDIFNIGNL